MDTATQALLGATIGQAFFARRLGRRALGWGAVAGLAPDLDVVAVATHGPYGELLYHRGVTHSLWFGPVVGAPAGWLAWRSHARNRARDGPRAPDGVPDPGSRAALRAWIGLFVLALFTHPLLDVFTVYGTQLLAPFSNQRFALNGVGIIDPFYSGVLVAALLVGWATRRRPAVGAAVAAGALAVSTLYLGVGYELNRRAEADIRELLARDGMPDAQVRVYPTILQPLLRRVVARGEGEVRVGLYTNWTPGRVAWESFEPRTHPLIDRVRETFEGRTFVWFAMDQVTGRVLDAPSGPVVEIDDLRYGLPGAPDQGMWGIRAAFDRRGRLIGPIVRFQRGRVRPGLGDLWRRLWRAAFGDLTALTGVAG